MVRACGMLPIDRVCPLSVRMWTGIGGEGIVILWSEE